MSNAIREINNHASLVEVVRGEIELDQIVGINTFGLERIRNLFFSEFFIIIQMSCLCLRVSLSLFMSGTYLKTHVRLRTKKEIYHICVWVAYNLMS